MNQFKQQLASFVILAIVSSGSAVAQQDRPPSQAPPSGNPVQLIEDCLNRIDAGDYQDAYQLFERARRLDPEQGKLKLIEGLILMQGNQASKALSALEAFNSSEQGRLEWRGFAAVGRCCRELRWHRQAIRPLEQAMKLAPPTDVNGKPVRAIIIVDLAASEAALRQTKKAADHAKEAENIAPNNAEVQQRAAEIHALLGDFQSAMKALNRAIGIQTAKVASNPLSQKEHSTLVSMYDLKLQLCSKLREEKPKEPATYIEAADAIRIKSDLEKQVNLLQARDAALKTLAADPKISSLQVFCAGIEMELGGYDDALDRLNQVLRTDPSNKEATALRQTVQDKLRGGRAKP